VKFQENLTLQPFKVIQGHRSWCQWKADMICDFLLVINCNFTVDPVSRPPPARPPRSG